MNRQRLIEWGKTLLIVVLAVSATLLSGIWTLIGDFIGADNTPANGINSEIQASHSVQAARPMTIMITTAENAHHGVKYDGEALHDAYSWFTASLGEALGTCGEPQEVNSEQWESALHGSGVFFDYLYDQSIDAIAQWLGMEEISSDASLHTARRLCLAVEGDSVALYYIRAVDGKAYRCSTAVSSESLQSRLAEYVPNGAMFVFETGGSYSAIDPYYAVIPELKAINELTASNPLQGTEGEALLSSFGMSELVANRYVESDGEEVFVEGERSLRISSGGRLLYSCLDGKNVAQSLGGAPGVIAKASTLINSLPCSDVWELQMTYIGYDSSKDEYTVRFDYIENGVIVCFAGRQSAIEIVISGKCGIVKADIYCRAYKATDSVIPMPERQALAVITELGGGEPMLSYTDDGQNVSLVWVIKN